MRPSWPAAYGAWTLLQSRRLGARVAAALLLVTVPIQFAYLYANYMGPYRLASASWFAGSAREGVRAAMDQAQGTSGPIYISSHIDWVHRIWRFYAISDGRIEMIERAAYVAAPPSDSPPGSLFLCAAGAADCSASAAWQPVAAVTSIDGSRTFNVLRRSGAEGR